MDIVGAPQSMHIIKTEGQLPDPLPRRSGAIAPEGAC